jgi:hypothetical protein
MHQAQEVIMLLIVVLYYLNVLVFGLAQSQS